MTLQTNFIFDQLEEEFIEHCEPVNDIVDNGDLMEAIIVFTEFEQYYIRAYGEYYEIYTSYERAEYQGDSMGSFDTVNEAVEAILNGNIYCNVDNTALSMWM